MLTWFKILPIELDSIAEYLDPQTAVGYKEKVVGTISDDLKKLYTFWKFKDKESEQNKIDVKFAKSQEDRAEATVLLIKNSEISDCLMRLFWIALKDELDLWKAEGNIGIRSGFQVVITESLNPQDLLDMFFGGSC